MSISTLITSHGVEMTRYEVTDSKDAGGAPIKAYTADLTLVTVFLQPAKANESVIVGGARVKVDAVGYILDGASVGSTDRLSYSGRYYEVLGILTPDMRPAGDALAYRIAQLSAIEGIT